MGKIFKIFGFLANFIPGVGPIVGLVTTWAPKVFGWVQGAIKTSADHDVQVRTIDSTSAVQLGTAAIAADAKTSEQWLQMMQTFKTTQWLITAALVPMIAHQSMLVLDYTPFPYIWGDGWMPTVALHALQSWHVGPLPADYAVREWESIKQLLGIQGAVAGAMGLLHWLHK